MTVLVQSRWQGIADRVDVVLTYPTGGVAHNVTIPSANTAADLAAAIDVAFTAATASGWTVTVNATTGAYRIRSDALNFDATFHATLAAHLAVTTGAYANVSDVTGADYPESRYLSPVALVATDPAVRWRREAELCPGGRVVARLIDWWPELDVTLRAQSITAGSTWDHLRAWLEHYTLRGVPFRLWRGTGANEYGLTASPVVTNGWSDCVVLADQVGAVRRQLVEGHSQARVDVTLRCRVLGGL